MIVQYETLKANNQSPYMDGDQLADIADQYASERRFKEAQEVISYGLGLHPGHTDLMVEQAYLFLISTNPGKPGSGGPYHRHLLRQRQTTLAELLLNEGKLDDADQILDSIEEEEKTNSAFWSMLSTCIPI